jgi:hypothetical protein
MAQQQPLHLLQGSYHHALAHAHIKASHVYVRCRKMGRVRPPADLLMPRLLLLWLLLLLCWASTRALMLA